jgi:hypothetical protein
MKSLATLTLVAAIAAGTQLTLSAAFADSPCLVPGETGDSVSPVCVLGGGDLPRNILVTFGALAGIPDAATPSDAMTSQPDPSDGSFHYRGVTYRPLDYDPVNGTMAMVIGGSNDDVPFGDLFDCRPVTRYVKVPLLAIMGTKDLPSIGVELVFDEPTPFVGFGYGFNSLYQDADGRLTGPIGWVRLYNEGNKLIGGWPRPLFASRLLCCTEGDFDYVAPRGGHGDARLVKRAVIKLTANYTPFDPDTGGEGTHKFLGIDWVRYQRTETVPACDGEE